MPSKAFPAALLLAAFIGSQAAPAESSVERLRKRLAEADADAVNAYLDTDSGWKQDGLPFFTRVKQCDQAAMTLALALLKSTNASATKGNSDLLELAMGKCPERLLALVPHELVPRFCAVDAWAESKKTLATPSAQLVEIERRLVILKRSPSAASENVRTCISSYTAKQGQLRRAQ